MIIQEIYIQKSKYDIKLPGNFKKCNNKTVALECRDFSLMVVRNIFEENNNMIAIYDCSNNYNDIKD